MSDANPNRIAIHSWHMNPGHYASNTGYKLTIRTLWSENYVFAADEEEARATIPRQKINQDQPDLGLFANAADLPIDMPKPGKYRHPHFGREPRRGYIDPNSRAHVPWRRHDDTAGQRASSSTEARRTENSKYAARLRRENAFKTFSAGE